MSDSDFVDVGDELVVRIAGYPVGKARVYNVTSEGVWTEMKISDKVSAMFRLPLDFKDYDQVDGVAHEANNNFHPPR